MRYQLIPAAALAAVMALCGYFVTQLHSERDSGPVPLGLEMPAAR